MKTILRLRGCQLALAAFLLPLCSLAQDRGQSVQEVIGTNVSIPAYHALVIGINDYANWQKLRQAREDAEALAGLLKSGYGFTDVRTLLDGQATRSAILKELYSLSSRLGPSDSLLIYYAGHGYFDRKLDSGYWVPVDGPETVNGEPNVADWIQDVTLKDLLSKTKARHVLVLSDACFSGALLRGNGVDLSTKENTYYRTAIGQPTRWIITSGDLESVPDESVFSRKVVQVLQYPRQSVFAGSDVAGWIKKDVAELTGRQMRFGPMRTVNSSDAGEFVFISRGAVGIPGPVSIPPRVSAGPSEIQLYGKLVLKSAVSGTVAIDGAGDWRIEPNKGLQWDRLDVGRHTVRVESGGKRWEKAIVVADGGTVSEMATFGAQPGGELAVDLGNDVKMEFVWIEALKGWVGKYEVTNEEYRRFKADHTSGAYESQSLNGDRQPVVMVSYDDAVSFAAWVNSRSVLPEGYKARLPDGKEWLTFAQCGDGREYPWGSEWPPPQGAGNYCGQETKGIAGSMIDGYNDGHPVTCDVGQSGINTWGLYGVGGNVWEWTSELYGTSGARVLRGASWDGFNQEYLRCSFRFNGVPSNRIIDFGFRLVVLR